LLQHCHGILGQVQSGVDDALEPEGEVRIFCRGMGTEMSIRLAPIPDIFNVQSSPNPSIEKIGIENENSG